MLAQARFLLLLNVILSSFGSARTETTRYSVLILGGGVSGVIAARSLVRENVTDILIVEARSELGGRLQSRAFGKPGRQKSVELGANWVQGTQTGDGPSNPIWDLAKKHNIETVVNDWTNISEHFSMQTYSSLIVSQATFDVTGQVDYADVFDKSGDDYSTLTVAAGLSFFVQIAKVD